MASDVTPIERLEMQPVDVDPEAIEAEFTRVWRETSGAGFDESSVRLRVVNLVALARGDSERARFEDLMGVLPERHPCRGILALTDGGRETLEAMISAHCWRSTGGEIWCDPALLLEHHGQACFAGNPMALVRPA